MENNEPKVGMVCMSINQQEFVCRGSNKLNKDKWCYHCNCYYPIDSVITDAIKSLCNCDNGIIYKRIKKTKPADIDRIDEYLVEDFCSCGYGKNLARNGYSLKVFKKFASKE